jgi:hypothetical protein
MLVVEVEQFFAKVEVFERRRPTPPDLQRILVVVNRRALLRRQHRHVAVGNLVRLAALARRIGWSASCAVLPAAGLVRLEEPLAMSNFSLEAVDRAALPAVTGRRYDFCVWSAQDRPPKANASLSRMVAQRFVAARGFAGTRVGTPELTWDETPTTRSTANRKER